MCTIDVYSKTNLIFANRQNKNKQKQIITIRYRRSNMNKTTQVQYDDTKEKKPKSYTLTSIEYKKVVFTMGV